MNFNNITKLFNEKFTELFERLNFQFKNSTEKILVRKEENKDELKSRYLLEIIDKNKINTDDYGIVVCMNLNHKVGHSVLTIETLKSFGPIINTRVFELPSENLESTKSVQVENALAYLDKLPQELNLYVEENFQSNY